MRLFFILKGLRRSSPIKQYLMPGLQNILIFGGCVTPWWRWCMCAWKADVLDKSISMRDGRVWDIFVLENYRVWYLLIVGLLESEHVGAVLFQWRVQVPTLDCMIVTWSVCTGFFMDKHGEYHWDEGHSVLVEWSKHGGISWYSGSRLGFPYYIEGWFGLGKDTFPLIHREVGFHDSNNAHKMLFEYFDGYLHNILSMSTWWH